MPEKFKVWLQFIKVDENKAKYNIYAEEVKDCIFVFQVGFKNIWFQRNYRSGSGIEANVLKLALETIFFFTSSFSLEAIAVCGICIWKHLN